MTTFKNPNDPDNLIIKSKVQEWMRSVMKLEEHAKIQVEELDCADPGCIDKETRITLIPIEGNKEQFRIHKPLVFVRKPDIEHLLKGK